MKKIFLTAAALLALGGLVAVNAEVRRATDRTDNTRPMQRIVSNAGEVAPSRNGGLQNHGLRSFGSSFSTDITNPFTIHQNRQIKAAADVAPFEIYGYVCCTDGSMTQGVYSITNSGLRLLNSNVMKPDGGAWSDGNLYYVVNKWIPSLEIYDFYSYSTTTWWQDSKISGINAKLRASDMALDPVSGKVYGCYSDGNATPHWKFDCADFSASTPARSNLGICDINAWNAVAADRKGELYVIDMLGDVYKIDKTNGRHSAVGSTGITPYYSGSGAISAITGKFYWSMCPETGAGGLYEVSLEDGSAQLLLEYPEGIQVVGLAVPGAAVNAGAPGIVMDFNYDSEPGAYEGKFSFTVPANLFGGEPGEGEVNWEIQDNGWKMLGGTAAYGEKVEVPFQTQYGGRYNISLKLSNDAGVGPLAKIAPFIGKDKPADVSGLRAVRRGDKVTISWDPVTVGKDGGYIDPENVTYSVMRITGTTSQVEIAKDIKVTSFEDEITEPSSLTYYRYVVSAAQGSEANWGIESNFITHGHYSTPYWGAMSNANNFNWYYTVENADNDIPTWNFYNSGDFICYAGNEGNDDWLYTSSIYLEEGKSYIFKGAFRSYNNNNPDQFEVKVGKNAVSDEMTIPVIASTTPSTTSTYYEGEIIVPESGNYNVGIHCNTPQKGGGLHVKDIQVSAPLASGTPGEVTELKALTALDGSNTVTLSFKAPELDRVGKPLTVDIDPGVQVKLDGANLQWFWYPERGESLSLEKTFDAPGVHTFEVVPYTSAGAGRSSSITVYAGVNTPGNPQGVNAVVTGDNQVTVSWNPVSVDVDGNPIRPELVSYGVLELKGEEQTMIAQDLTATSYSFTVEGSEQQFRKYAVFAKSSAGMSQGVVAPQIPVGPAYTLPFVESFPGGVATKAWAVKQYNYYSGSWYLADKDAFTDVSAADGDDGFAYHYCKYIDCPSMLYSGRINMTGVENPILSFYLLDLMNNLKDRYDYANTSELDIQVDLLDGQGWRSVKKNVICEVCDEMGWNRILIDMREYKGKTLQLGLVGNTKKYVYVNIDAIRIDDIENIDMEAKYVQTVENVRPGEDFTVGVRVENRGLATNGNYTVELYRDGKLVDAAAGPELKVGERTTIDFEQNLVSDNEETVEYSARVITVGDEVPSNDATEVVKVILDHPVYPVPENVSAVLVGKDEFKLTWTEPDLKSVTRAPVTDSFETYCSWSNTNCGDWIFIDEDHGGAGGAQNVTMPGVPNGSEQSWWILDTRLEVLDRNLENEINFAPHTGNKMLAAMYGMDFSTGAYPTTPVRNDDWAISPELSGEAQTIKFFARSYSNYFPEQFEIYYSTSTNDLDDFELLDETGQTMNVPVTWTEYSYTLPAGAKYFAIRYNGNWLYMLFVDDVTYTAADSDPLNHLGYNIYRDGQKLNDDTHQELEFSEKDVPNTHHYAVTALYAQGESRPARAVVNHIYSGVEEVEGSNVAIISKKGNIIVCNAEGLAVSIADLQGRLIYDGKGLESMNFSVAPGVYVVRAGNTVAKIIVK